MEDRGNGWYSISLRPLGQLQHKKHPKPGDIVVLTQHRAKKQKAGQHGPSRSQQRQHQEQLQPPAKRARTDEGSAQMPGTFRSGTPPLHGRPRSLTPPPRSVTPPPRSITPPPRSATPPLLADASDAADDAMQVTLQPPSSAPPASTVSDDAATEGDMIDDDANVSGPHAVHDIEVVQQQSAGVVAGVVRQTLHKWGEDIIVVHIHPSCACHNLGSGPCSQVCPDLFLSCSMLVTVPITVMHVSACCLYHVLHVKHTSYSMLTWRVA